VSREQSEFIQPTVQFLTKHQSTPSNKISVYCCGSNQVKKDVQLICQRLNADAEICSMKLRNRSPIYSYHEENF